MPINWRNAMKMAKARRQRHRNPVDPNEKLPFEESQHYADALPEEAIMMSQRGKAKGYDDFWWGPDFRGNLPAIVEISEKGVQWLILNDAEKAWLAEVENEPTRQQARREMIHNWNWTSWEDLLPINREFLLSLMWIPVDPYNAMEILARAAR